MKILSNEETKAWVSHKVTREALQSEYSYRVAYLLPGDAGKKTALAKGLVNAIDPAPMGLLWITQFGVWPSSENMDLFTGYRTSLGEHRSLRDAPGHLFDKSELVSLQSLLSLALYFLGTRSCSMAQRSL